MIDYLFHIHTYRCKHAENVSEEIYVQKALEYGYKEIYFSDHSPFPGNPFTNRMDYEELTEYIDTLTNLNKAYNGINIHIGLETEYLPEFKDYYKDLVSKVDFLLLGQHIFTYKNQYSFELPHEIQKSIEYLENTKLIKEAIETGLFTYIAHPDRIFRYCGEWNKRLSRIAFEIIEVAIEYNVKLEQNYESKQHPNYYREEFWDMVPCNMIIQGIDAHSLSDINKFNNTQKPSQASQGKKPTTLE